jgi:integrase
VTGLAGGDLVQKVFAQQMTQLSSKPVMTFENYALEWLKSKPNLNTRATYGKYLKADINPYFGNKRLDEITLDDMFTFFSGLQEDDYAKSTANSLKTVIKQVLQCAVTDGYIHVNPAADPRIKNPCTKETERKPLTEEQWSDIVHQIHDKLYNDDRLYMYLVSYTAARKGEVLAMRYEDFDFDKLKLTISRNVTFPDGYNPNIGPTKGKKIRTIDISKELAEELRARFKTCPKKGFLFHREGDFEKPYTSNLFWQMWERIRKSIDLHGATSHVFRHTVLTMLNNKGVDLKTISAIAGHASETTTYTYIHTNDAKKKEAMSLLTANVA